MKRSIDVVGAALGLAVLSPALLLIAAAIRLETRGPALFKQTRIGKDGVPFTFYKFRTMMDGNDPSRHQSYVQQLISQPSEGLRSDNGVFKIEDDDRVTKVGKLLRRTSVDELPQLLNVVLGDMSLVGPRPPLPYEAELYSAHARRRLECTPGMTGLWQVSGRCSTTFDEMIELDIAYMENWSLGLDMTILARTLPAVIGGRGAV